MTLPSADPHGMRKLLGHAMRNSLATLALAAAFSAATYPYRP